MTRVRFPSIWDDDDPAVARLREALALRPPPEKPLEPPSSPPERASGPTDDTAEVSALLTRAKGGDRSAREALSQLVARLRK